MVGLVRVGLVTARSVGDLRVGWGWGLWTRVGERMVVVVVWWSMGEVLSLMLLQLRDPETGRT